MHCLDVFFWHGKVVSIALNFNCIDLADLFVKGYESICQIKRAVFRTDIAVKVRFNSREDVRFEGVEAEEGEEGIGGEVRGSEIFGGEG